jgi:hypothetical protein
MGTILPESSHWGPAEWPRIGGAKALFQPIIGTFDPHAMRTMATIRTSANASQATIIQVLPYVPSGPPRPPALWRHHDLPLDGAGGQEAKDD